MLEIQVNGRPVEIQVDSDGVIQHMSDWNALFNDGLIVTGRVSVFGRHDGGQDYVWQG